MSQGIFAIRNQQVVEVRSGTDDARIPDAHRENDIVGRRTELDVVAEDFTQFGPRSPVMDQSNALGDDAKSCQLAARANQGGNPKLDLVAIRMAAHADVV